MKKKKKKKLPEAVEAAFHTHAGVSIEELEALMLKAENRTITPAEQARLDRALMALAFEDAE